eukprot:157925-Amphidinium_carterae.7
MFWKNIQAICTATSACQSGGNHILTDWLVLLSCHSAAKCLMSCADHFFLGVWHLGQQSQDQTPQTTVLTKA